MTSFCIVSTIGSDQAPGTRKRNVISDPRALMVSPLLCFTTSGCSFVSICFALRMGISPALSLSTGLRVLIRLPNSAHTSFSQKAFDIFHHALPPCLQTTQPRPNSGWPRSR